MPRRYLDSCVLRLAYHGKEDEPRTQRALDELNREDSVFLYSRMVELELLPMPTRNRQLGEVEFYEDYFADAEFIACTVSAQEIAMEEGSRLGMGALDALHVGCATVGEADELVTAEGATKPMNQAATVRVRTIA